MDSIGGISIWYFNKEVIGGALKDNPTLLNQKKMMELFAGYLVACMMQKEYELDLMVGLPLKNAAKQSQPTTIHLEDVINNPDFIDDSDVDIYIGDNRREYICRCQVTRLVAKSKNNIIMNDLSVLLRNKCRIQPDKKLILIVNVEYDFLLDCDQLSSLLSSMSIPYGSIYIVGKPVMEVGKFKFLQIYPEMIEGNEFEIGIPL